MNTEIMAPGAPPLTEAGFVIAIFVLALLARATALFELVDTPFLSVLMADAARYDAWAREIAGGDWFGREVFYQAPFYPYFLAVCYQFFGHHLLLVRVIQIILGAAGCVLLARAGRSFFSPAVGLLAGALLALYPPAIFFDLLMQKAALANFLLLLLLALLGRLRKKARWHLLIAAGVVLGCLALTRENTRVLYVVIAAWLLIRSLPPPDHRSRWLSAAAFTLGLTAVLLPVGLRNQQVGGELVLTTSQLGPNFYIGNNPDADGTYRALRPGRGNPEHERRDATELAEQALGRALSAREVSDYWLDRSTSYIRARPGHWSRLMLRKCLLVLNAEEQADAESIGAYRQHSWVLRLLGGVWHFGILLPLAVVGIWSTRKQWRRLWLLWAIAGSLAASVALFYVFARYRFSIVPVLALFAAAGVLELATLLRRREWAPVAVAVALAAGAALVAHLPLSVQLDVKALTYNNLGVALARGGRVAEATDWYRRAVTTDPGYATAHYNLGVALLDQNDLESASTHFHRARQLEPEFALAHYNLGVARVRQGRVEEAVGHYRRALNLQPRDAEIHSNLGVALEIRGDLRGAAEHYLAAVELRPDFPEAHYNLGNARLRLGEYEPAAGAYLEALRLRPDYAEAHFNLGVTRYQQGDVEQAIRHVRSALEIRPDFAAARSTLEGLLAEAARGSTTPPG